MWLSVQYICAELHIQQLSERPAALGENVRFWKFNESLYAVLQYIYTFNVYSYNADQSI